MGIPSSGATVPTPPAGDLANAVVAGSFVLAGVSAVVQLYGSFNLLLYGGVAPNTAWGGTVNLERSFDGGTTWITCGVGGTGTQASYATGTDVSVMVTEIELGVLYRLRCVTHTAGTIFYRISTSGIAAMTFPGN